MIKATSNISIPRLDQLHAMNRMIDNFGLFTRQLGDLLSREKNSKNRATVQGKLNKLLEVQVILRSDFLTLFRLGFFENGTTGGVQVTRSS